MADDQPTASANRELAARIVAAYVRRNQVGFDQIPALISTVHQAVAGLGKPEPEDAGRRIPAISLPICSARLSCVPGLRAAL